MFDIHLRLRRLWIYFPGHAGVKKDDRANRLVGKATITNELRFFWKSEVLRSLRSNLWAKSQHHTIDSKEKGVEQGRRSTLQGQDREPVSTSATLELFWVLHLKNKVWERGWSAYVFYRTRTYHLLLKLNCTEHTTHASESYLCSLKSNPNTT